MKVIITATPEYSIDQQNEIVSLLKETPGEMEFKLGNQLTFRQYRKTKPMSNDAEITQGITFEESYDLCETYRDQIDIPDDNYVVMITSIVNDCQWYSAYEGKNIFVYTNGLDNFSEADSKYGISFQIVENIFQSLLMLNLKRLDSEPNIHFTPIGCINDFCKYRESILIKLRVADICKSCTDKAIAMNVSPKIMRQISVITEVIRTAYINKNKVQPSVTPEKVSIDNNANITIGGREINLDPRLKVIFIYFLKNPKGLTTMEFCSHKEDFFRIYQSISVNADIEIIKRMCCKDRKSEKPTTFKAYRSKLKLSLEKQLGEPLAKFYIIERTEITKSNFSFKINLSPDYLDIDPRF